MNLLTLFLFTQIIYSIIGTFFFIVLISLAILIFRDINRFSKKIDKFTEESLEAVQEAKVVTEKIGKTAMQLLMIKILKVINKNID